MRENGSKNDGQIKNCYSPSQVSSLILKKLKDYTSDVKKAVITVPAMFAEEARQATLDAAKMAEIEVIELINEPTAAVLHYASLPGVEVGGRVMIYDLGGGTFDVTIAEVKNKKVDVITSRGDKYLGGKDFDAEIVKLFDKKYNNKNGVNLDLDNKYFYQKGRGKKILSVKDKTNVFINGPKGEMEIEITEMNLKNLFKLIWKKTKMLIEEVMEASGMNPKRINQVLLVGGSTRITAVVKSLTKLMGKPPVKGVNVDEAVVCGAAIYAGLKTEKKSLNEKQKEALSQVELTDVCNFYMGTLAHVTNPTTGREEIMNTIIINRDAKLPVAITKRYYTISENQTAIECSVTQSEGEENNREFVNIIHQGKLELPPNRPSHQPIDVTYSYDVSGKIHCLFTIQSSNKHEIELNLSNQRT